MPIQKKRKYRPLLNNLKREDWYLIHLSAHYCWDRVQSRNSFWSRRLNLGSEIRVRQTVICHSECSVGELQMWPLENCLTTGSFSYFCLRFLRRFKDPLDTWTFIRNTNYKSNTSSTAWNNFWTTDLTFVFGNRFPRMTGLHIFSSFYSYLK